MDYEKILKNDYENLFHGDIERLKNLIIECGEYLLMDITELTELQNNVNDDEYDKIEIALYIMELQNM